MSAPAQPIKMKICMAGQASVGKTSLIRRYVLDEYEDRYIATLGTKITKKKVTVPAPRGGQPVAVDIILWDIMGTSMIRELLKEAYYHGAMGIFAVADLTRKETLRALDDWARSIRSVAGNIPTYGVVNKQDLEPDRELSADEVEAFFGKRGWPWSYTSAKTGVGVEESFHRLVEIVLASRDVVRQSASDGGPPRPS